MRVLALTGGVAAFAGAVAAGALVIIAVMPGERFGPTGENALLMERAAPLKPLDLPPASASGQAEQRQGAALSERPTRQPIAALPDTVPSLGADAPDAADAAAPPQRQTAPAPVPSRETPRTKVLAALPPTAIPPAAVAPPPPLPRLKRAPEPRPDAGPRADTVMTPAEVRRIKLSLRLTREQEPYWFPVEQMLLEIGTQQAALVRSGQSPGDAFGIGAAMRMSSVARPLLDVLREDQKVQVRARARAMGFGSVASSI